MKTQKPPENKRDEGEGDGECLGNPNNSFKEVKTVKVTSTLLLTARNPLEKKEDVGDSPENATTKNVTSINTRVVPSGTMFTAGTKSGETTLYCEASSPPPLDLLLHPSNRGGGGGGFDLFRSDEGGEDLTLSPETFTSSTEAFLNENSNSLGVSCPDNDTVESSEDSKGIADSSRLSVKKPRPKPTSPNRQGPQQCQVCGKVFGNASALAKHKLTHSDERKYVCSMCGKAFKRQDHLNGHMLTHRNKKPYECKAEGCGKSYCDARSLRRHTENHHSSSSSLEGVGKGEGGGGSGDRRPISVGKGGGLGMTQQRVGDTGSQLHNSDGGGESESGGETEGSGPSSSCIQYAPPPSPKPTSHLQQLLNAQTPSVSTTTANSKTKVSHQNNEGLTNQQLQLIQQIMEETQNQGEGKRSPTSTTPTTTTTRQKTWTLQTTPFLAKTVTSTKPVECNLCHRKFKNIPALNGHMRLHGGYFKKDSETKKSDKKELVGPPLQTASMSVRALIEEKIIQKRITNPIVVVSTASTTGEEEEKKSEGFAVPSAPKRDSVPSGVQGDHPSTTTTNRKSAKRTSSDPSTLQSTPPNESPNQFHLNLQPDGGYSLGIYNEDGDYFTPPIQEDVFQQVQSVQDSLLLQGVDPTQLAESIQAATLQDIASLEDYQTTTGSLPSPQSFQHHQDLQNVLDSPLPVSLADFAYSHSHPTSSDSPIPSSTYTNSPPLSSPSFTYPTPPASQEGNSPSGIPSLQSVISHSNVSSPLSTGFYSSTMSSSAAVEAALNEVLPQQPYPSPPPQSPLCNTPVHSPLSIPPSSTSPTPHQSLQSQMMPNSEDPLLSSSPKDFTSRKRFDFQTFKLLGNNTIELGAASTQGVTGIVLDRNGELKFIQTSFQSLKAGILNGTPIYFNTKTKNECPQALNTGSKLIKNFTPVNKTSLDNKLKSSVHLVENLKEELEDDVFLSPSISTSPVRTVRKKLKLENGSPGNPIYPSRLRPIKNHCSGKQYFYTPAPILHPNRHGQGLYWQAITTWPSSTTSIKDSGNDESVIDSANGALESDSFPHINIGQEYQCTIPLCRSSKHLSKNCSADNLLWDPSIIDVTSETELDMYLEFACCAAVPGGGRNKEYALHLLQLCDGKVHEAMLKLMQPTPSLPSGHPLLTFEYNDSDRWNSDEMETFHQALLKYDKDFKLVAQEIGSKSAKQCVQFYYLWKKVCPEEYKRWRLIRRRSRESEYEAEVSKSDIPVNDVELVTTSSESRLFICEYPDCSASFNSRAALNGHIRIHVGGTTGRCPTPDKRCTSSPAHVNIAEPVEEFPCKICGK